MEFHEKGMPGARARKRRLTKFHLRIDWATTCFVKPIHDASVKTLPTRYATMNAETISPSVDADFDPFAAADDWDVLETRMREWEQSTPKNVLLIGADTEETEQFAQAIGDAGFSCRTCNSGSEALRSSRLEFFPLVAIRRGLPDVGGEDLARMLRTHNLPEAEIILLETTEATTAAAEMEQAHTKRLRATRKDRFYAETLGGALYSGISRLKHRNQGDETSRTLHSHLRQEIEKLACADSEITRDEDTFKNFLAESLDESPAGSPEGLLERAIRVVKDINREQADAGSDEQR